MIDLPEIPQTWLVLLLLVTMCFLRWQGIDSFTTAGLSGVAFYILGKHIEQQKYEVCPPDTPQE